MQFNIVKLISFGILLDLAVDKLMDDKMTVIATSPVRQHLNVLRRRIESITIRGCFLLSTGEISNYWVPIGELRTCEVTDAIISILRVCLPKFQREANVGAVFWPQFTTTSEDDFPLDFIVSQRPRTEATEQTLSFCSVNFDRHHNRVDLPEDSPLDTWLGIFTISVHTDMITSILDALYRRKRIVRHVLVIVERDKVTRNHLLQRGVQLVPLVVCDEHTGEPATVLDLMKQPYASYHKYFE